MPTKIIDDVVVTTLNNKVKKPFDAFYATREHGLKGEDEGGKKFLKKYKKYNKFVFVKSLKDKAIIEHEMSHSRRNPKYLYGLSKLGVLPAVSGMTLGLLTKKKRYAALGSLVGSLPTLIEEGHANLDAYKKTKDLKVPSISMGSYLLGAGLHTLPSIVGTHVFNSVRNK
jgi:hypothetical protein